VLSGLAPGNYQLDVRKASPHAICHDCSAQRQRRQSHDIGHTSSAKRLAVALRWRVATRCKASDFPGKGELKINNESLILGSGNDLTGVTWTQDIPRTDYEISFDARRAAGNDFFSGVTFPVAIRL
jgi:hypothetical protein